MKSDGTKGNLTRSDLTHQRGRHDTKEDGRRKVSSNARWNPPRIEGGTEVGFPSTSEKKATRGDGRERAEKPE